jgi:hypothetical protein
MTKTTPNEIADERIREFLRNLDAYDEAKSEFFRNWRAISQKQGKALVGLNLGFEDKKKLAHFMFLQTAEQAWQITKTKMAHRLRSSNGGKKRAKNIKENRAELMQMIAETQTQNGRKRSKHATAVTLAKKFGRSPRQIERLMGEEEERLREATASDRSEAFRRLRRLSNLERAFLRLMREGGPKRKYDT